MNRGFVFARRDCDLLAVIIVSRSHPSCQTLPRNSGGSPSASIMGPTASGPSWSTWPTAARWPRASTTIPAARQASCWTRKTRTWPGKTRPTISTASISSVGGAVRAARRQRGFRPEQVVGHRRRYDRLDADPGRSPGHAAGPASRVLRQSGGPRLAVEGPHELCRGGRNHREGHDAAATATWPSAAASTAANGTGRRFCTAGGPRRRFSPPPTPGSNWPISSPPISPATSIPDTLAPRHLRGRPQGHV